MLLVKKTEKTKKTPTRCRRGAGTVHMPESKGNRGNKKSMQEDQIGQIFMGLAPGDMARLPHLIN
jgi:hypothetical protein